LTGSTYRGKGQGSGGQKESSEAKKRKVLSTVEKGSQRKAPRGKAASVQGPARKKDWAGRYAAHQK